MKPFDASTQLASECFGGETTSKTYDSTSDKFMDLSFEKTNSAYMLFYERKKPKKAQKNEQQVTTFVNNKENDELMRSIWLDNIKFMNDKQILEHGYFNFIWQMCDYVPRKMIGIESTTSTEIEMNLTSLILATKLGTN